MASKKLEKIIAGDKQYLFQNYGDRLPVCFTRGDGSHLFDQDNGKYIDFFSGIAVSCLGYNHPRLSRALHNQVDRIMHSSNWYYNAEQIEAAKLVSELTFPGKTLFVNSGTEANEAAIKLARRYGKATSKDRYGIVTFEGCFHGRTFGAMSATAQEKIQKGFEPLLPGFRAFPYNRAEAVVKELDSSKNICAVIMELVQGEGGIIIAEKPFVKSIADACKRNGVLLIIDEVQTGVGRTGKFCGYEHYGIRPDVITFAKGIAGGFPMGALHTRDDLAGCLEKGSHGTTFGGNHFASAAAVAVLKEFKSGKLLESVRKNGQFIMDHINKIKAQTDCIKEVRGLGMHIGIEFKSPGANMVKKALERGLVINCTSEKVIRIMPPLTITMKTIKEGLAILDQIIAEEGTPR